MTERLFAVQHLLHVACGSHDRTEGRLALESYPPVSGGGKSGGGGGSGGAAASGWMPQAQTLPRNCFDETTLFHGARRIALRSWS